MKHLATIMTPSIGNSNLNGRFIMDLASFVRSRLLMADAVRTLPDSIKNIGTIGARFHDINPKSRFESTDLNLALEFSECTM